MRMRLVVQLPPAAIRHVRVQLRRRQVGVAEHLLDGAEVGAALEQMGRERVAQQVRMDPRGVEAGLRGETAEDEEGARTRQRAAAGVEEELGPVPRVEIWTASGDVAA